MPISAQDTDHAVDVLNQLLETTRDGEAGFTAAADGAGAPDLRGTCKGLAAQRAAFSDQLVKVITNLGGEPAESGHAAGALHRGWMNIRTAVSANDDRAILEECERGEDYAKKAFGDALKEPLPESLHGMLRQMNKEIIAAHDRVRDLRNRARADSE